MEIGLDIDTNYDRWNEYEMSEQKQSSTFYGKVFSPENQNNYASLLHRVNTRDVLIVGDPRGKVEAGVSYRWGGKDGPKGNAHIEGEIKDKHGNYLKGEARVHSDGEKEVRGKAGNDQQDKQKKKD
ncbi:MAG TPA: hypothetical protein PKW79_03580 [Rhabdochlamydiaceae bacterium]|nr:hypothetical protein [Rhabdochlamydiaceae bacterium]